MARTTINPLEFFTEVSDGYWATADGSLAVYWECPGDGTECRWVGVARIMADTSEREVIGTDFRDALRWMTDVIAAATDSL